MKVHSEYSNLLQFDLLKKESAIEHFTTTRTGGVSKGTFSSFNLGNFSEDDPAAIYRNRNILARMWHKDQSDFIVPHQTHGTNVMTIDHTFLKRPPCEQDKLLYGVDALITQEKGLFLCVTTADCVPILLYDTKNHAIATIHAGWRGTVERIVEKTINEMIKNYHTLPHNIIGGIGPAISMKNYEIGENVKIEFSKQKFDLSTTSCRKRTSSPIHIDLKEINRLELIRLGIPENQIEKTDLCTYENSDLFFSARRQSIHCGRMLSGIMLK